MNPKLSTSNSVMDVRIQIRDVKLNIETKRWLTDIRHYTSSELSLSDGGRHTFWNDRVQDFQFDKGIRSNFTMNTTKRHETLHFEISDLFDVFLKNLVLLTTLPFLLSQGQDVEYDQYSLRARWALSHVRSECQTLSKKPK